MNNLPLMVAMCIIIAGCTAVEINPLPSNRTVTNRTVSNNTAEYVPAIDPDDFTINITNPYFSMPVGKKMIYEATTEDGTERIETVIPGWTKEVMGVETLVFWDRVYQDGELAEDTRDYIAQDKEGNVWYFGEDVDNYVDGILTDHHGSWLGGEDGALPGIWMPAYPAVGQEYRQEYYRGEAEDMGRIDSVGVNVTVPIGAFDDCIKVFEWTPLESATAHKYHCRGAGGTVLEEEGDERVELIQIASDGAQGIALPESYSSEGVEAEVGEAIPVAENTTAPELEKEISEEDAERIALEAVPGRVTDLAIEKKFGRLAYVVEVDADDGPETDVIIDIDTGEVLGVET